MAAKALIVLWVVASEISSPTTLSLTHAFADAVSGEQQAAIEVRESDDQAGAAPVKHVAGSGVVLLRWTGDHHRNANLRCYLPQSHRWVSRNVRFAREDPEEERGRALGFLLASMYVDELSPKLPQPPREARARHDTPRPESPSDRDATSAVAISAAGSLAGPGDIAGFGAWLGVEFAVSSRATIGAAAEARLGSISAAQATTRVVDLLAGAEIRVLGGSRGPWLGLRSALGAAHVSTTHLSADDPAPDAQYRVLPLAEIGVRLGYGLGSLGDATVELGAQSPFSPTDIYVHGRQQATLAALYPVARLGVRAHL